VVNAGGKGSSTGAARAITGSGAPREVELGGPGEMGFPITVQKIVQNNFWIYLTKGCTFIDDVNMQYIAACHVIEGDTAPCHSNI